MKRDSETLLAKCRDVGEGHQRLDQFFREEGHVAKKMLPRSPGAMGIARIVLEKQFSAERGYDLFAQRLPLAEKLADLLQRQVELIPEHELNRHIRERIMQETVDL